MAVKTQGFDKAIKNMQARKKAFEGGKPYEDAGKIASESIAKNVEAGGRPKWKKRIRAYPHPILDKTGSMRDAAEESATKWQHGSIWHVNAIKGPFYGLVHQYLGVKSKAGKSIRKYVLYQQREVNAMIQAFRDAFHQK